MSTRLSPSPSNLLHNSSLAIIYRFRFKLESVDQRLKEEFWFDGLQKWLTDY